MSCLLVPESLDLDLSSECRRVLRFDVFIDSVDRPVLAVFAVLAEVLLLTEWKENFLENDVVADEKLGLDVLVIGS